MSAISTFQHNPALVVELGAAFTILAALTSRVLLSRFGIPAILTLLGFGIIAGPSALSFIHISVGDPPTRALLQLAVVAVVFEASLRMDLRGIPKRIIAVLAVAGTALTLFAIPRVMHAYHFSPLIGSMAAAICIVTGPTVIGPLMARLRPQRHVAHLLESEGLVLDAVGVLIAEAVFATYTSRPGTPLDAAWQVGQRIGAGIMVGVAWGFLGRIFLVFAARATSDISKLSVLFLGFAAYASSETAAHGSGLVAVVGCGLLLDIRALVHERLLRAFKEDLAMLALSTVFVLLASQVQISRLGALVMPAAAVTATLFVIRIGCVVLATSRSSFTKRERALMTSVFPRGIVAVSLATYYATQIPAWGLHGGSRLAGIIFLVVVFTIAVSTPLSIAVTRYCDLQMPAIVIAGITPATIEHARAYELGGHLPLLVDRDAHAVAYARSHDFDAQTVENVREMVEIARRYRAPIVVSDAPEDWTTPELPVVTPVQALFSQRK
jgi:NhaP-type Na+/H+ or K+/H+ antiporter